MIGRRPLLLDFGAALATPRMLGASALPQGAAQGAVDLVLNGAWRQGGYALGRTEPRALILVDGEVAEEEVRVVPSLQSETATPQTSTPQTSTPQTSTPQTEESAPR